MYLPETVKRLRTLCLPIIVTLLTLLNPISGNTHEAGVTDTSITILRDTIRLVYTVPENHIPDITGDDYNPLSTEPVIKSVLDGFSVRNVGEPCTAKSQRINRLDTIKSLQFEFVFDCGGLVRNLEITYQLLFSQNQSHKNFARITLLQHTHNVTFSNDNRSHEVDVESMVRQLADNQPVSSPVSTQLTSGSHYFAVGVEHILQGVDHLLFLEALFLPPLSFRQVLALITAFTVAHSMTLGLSVLNVVTVRPGLMNRR